MWARRCKSSGVAGQKRWCWSGGRESHAENRPYLGEHTEKMVFDWRDTACGMVGSVACVYVGMPFDVVKVRMQTRGPVSSSSSPPAASGTQSGATTKGARRMPRGRSPMQTAVHIFATEGVRKLWSGAVPALTSAMSENSALFTANDAIKRTVISVKRRFFHQEAAPPTGKPPKIGPDGLPVTKLSKREYFLCGGAAGFVSSTVMCPSEVVKVRLQVEAAAGTAYKGPIDCLVKTVRNEGFRRLYSGYSALLLRDMPFNAIFIGTYDSIVQMICRRTGRKKKTLPPVLFMLVGGVAGAISWGLVFPVDVLKSRMQSQNPPQSLAHTARSVLRNHGIRGLYHGWSAAVLRGFPANAALWGAVEFSRRGFQYFDPTYRAKLAPS